MGGEDDGENKPEIGAIHTRLDEDDLARASVALRAGELFANRYRVEALIGEGGSGSVYRVHDQTADTPVALKLLKTDRLVTPEARKRLIREALLTRNIRHPNIVAVYDVGEDNGQPYIAMEHLPGRSLRSWMSEHATGDAECSFTIARAIVLAVLEGLDAAHQLGVVHRDLKPENIFLVEEPGGDRVRLKLLDFGIAFAAGDMPSSSATGHSPYYVARELITAPNAVKASADIYSLCVIFYELLIGALPGVRWQAPSRARRDVPAEVDALIESGLSDHARSRPQTVAAFRAQLEPLTAQRKPEPQVEAPGADMVQKADALYADGWGFGGEYPDARDNYYMAAVLGNVAGMIGSAKMLARGHGGPADARMARVWLTKAAELGSKEAIQRLARFDELVAEGKANPQPQAEPAKPKRPVKPATQAQLDEASKVFDGMFDKEAPKKPPPKPAEVRAVSPAETREAALKRRQAGQPADLQRARELFLKAANGQDVEAMAQLGLMLKKGEGGPADPEGARNWFKAAADQGHASAANSLGLMWHNGEGGPKDLAQARECHRLAAEGGLAAAMCLYAIYLQHGHGGAKDPPGAREWFRKAADAGSVNAIAYLGLMLERGEGGAKDLPNARIWLKRSSEAGDRLGMFAYGMMLMNGAGGPADEAGAREWLKKSGDGGMADAYAYYAQLLAEGRGGPKDKVQAKHYAKIAADAGNENGKKLLQRL